MVTAWRFLQKRIEIRKFAVANHNLRSLMRIQRSILGIWRVKSINSGGDSPHNEDLKRIGGIQRIFQKERL